MKIQLCSALIARLALCALLTSAFSARAQNHLLLKFEPNLNIKGSSVLSDKKFADSIEVLSYQLGAENATTITVGSATPGGKGALVPAFNVTAGFDAKAYPELFAAVTQLRGQGTDVKIATLYVVRPTGGNRSDTFESLKIEIWGFVRAVSLSSTADDNGGYMSIDFAVARLVNTTTILKPDGSTEEKNPVGWDYVALKPFPAP